jgi:hypothetical protein
MLDRPLRCREIIPHSVQANVRQFFARRHQPRRPPLAKIRPGRPAPAMGPGTGVSEPEVATKARPNGASMIRVEKRSHGVEVEQRGPPIYPLNVEADRVRVNSDAGVIRVIRKRRLGSSCRRRTR